MSKVILVDLSWVMYRGLFSFTDKKILNGGITRPTGHAYSVIRLAKTLNADPSIDKIIFVRDLHPLKKKEDHPEYKEGRAKVYNVHGDYNNICSLFLNPKFRFVERKETECDDIIAVLSRYYSSLSVEVIVYSGDNDLLPLNLLNGVCISRKINNKKLVPLEPIYWMEKFKVPLEYLPLYRTLRGDSSDALTGIRGFPSKLAVEIATDLKDFKLFNLQFNNLLSKYGTTDSKRKYIFEIRKNYNKLLAVYTDIADILNIDFSLDSITESVKYYNVKESCDYFGFLSDELGFN